MPAALALRDVVQDYPAPRTLAELLRRPLRRRTVRALDGVNLAIEPGELLALIGPNGSGKTTCVKLLAGVLEPTRGEALAFGLPAGGRAEVGYVVADERSFEHRLSARENLRFFAALHGLPRRERDGRIAELAARLGIASRLDLPFRALSSGQKARVAIARGLLHRPRALLLDEVTRTLDPGAAARLRRFVAEELAGRERLAVLLTTHDLHEARALGGRVALLAGGRVRAEGSFGEVEPALEGAFAEEAA